jgi:hypothetical protein
VLPSFAVGTKENGPKFWPNKESMLPPTVECAMGCVDETMGADDEN